MRLLKLKHCLQSRKFWAVVIFANVIWLLLEYSWLPPTEDSETVREKQMELAEARANLIWLEQRLAEMSRSSTRLSGGNKKELQAQLEQEIAKAQARVEQLEQKLVETQAQWVPSSPTVTASRIFAGPNQYPPNEFAAYGILAFPSQPSIYDSNRYLMICRAYTATLIHTSELNIPRAEQMVTVWPIGSDSKANELNYRSSRDEACEQAVDNYGLVIAKGALNHAKVAGVDTSGRGPFLLAWSPATDKGKRDAVVLSANLSDITTYEQAKGVLLDWENDIEKNPKLWRNGWDVERIRVKIRLWVDRYGSQILALFYTEK